MNLRDAYSCAVNRTGQDGAAKRDTRANVTGSCHVQFDFQRPRFSVVPVAVRLKAPIKAETPTPASKAIDNLPRS